ncbi:MAG: hypothetical protein LBL93_05865 [Ruminococcus sp.]|nr:hypothetical protein [Ruminococcus sp.]
MNKKTISQLIDSFEFEDKDEEITEKNYYKSKQEFDAEHLFDDFEISPYNEVEENLKKYAEETVKRIMFP